LLRAAFPQSQSRTRSALVKTATVRPFQPGETILRQGDEWPLALVLDGHLAFRRTTPDGRQLIVRLIGRAQLAAVMPLAGRPAVADAVALTPGDIALWRGGDVRSTAARDPGLGLDLLDHVLNTFEEIVLRLDAQMHQDALRRVARVLDQHAHLFFADKPVLTRTQLPILVGTSREMTSRVLRILESRSLVARVGRSGLRLLDPDGLAEIAAVAN
jgi:CRP/FNR family transcriptional regulator